MRKFFHRSEKRFLGKREDLIGTQSSVPENVSYLSLTEFEKRNFTEIGFYWSPDVQHLRISNYQEPAYYDDYFMTTSYSETQQNLQEAQCQRLLSLLQSEKSSELVLLEVGCGDGSFLDHASRYFDVVGIEPSKAFASAASLKGHRVLNEYVTAKSNFFSTKVDAFVSRQVFEHLPDPLDCLIGIRNMLNQGGIGLIEVPNGYKAFRAGNFYEFFPDHVNYYSVNSLVALATTAGFNVISCHESFGGDYLELWIRNDIEQESWVEVMNIKAHTITSEVSKWINNTPNQTKAIFGCGAKTLSIIAKNSAFYNDSFSYVIDSDPNKQNKFIPNTKLQVISLNEAVSKPVDQVLVLALSYVREIAELIKANLGDNVQIVSIDIEGKLQELVI